MFFSYSVFRHFYFRKKKVKISHCAFTTQLNCSRGELEWLSYLEQTRFPNLLHRFNTVGKQHRLGNFTPDGLDFRSKTIFEFLGCHVHYHKNGCTKLPHNLLGTDRNYLGVTFNDALERLEKKLNFYRQNYSDWHLELLWACQWEKMRNVLNSDPYNFIKTIFDQYPTKRMNCRDFVRGKCQVVILFSKSI